MSTHSTRPMFLRNKWRSQEKLNVLRPSQTRLLRTYLPRGVLLWIICVGAVLLLSGCQPVVIRQACDPYPLPPKDLMQAPLNEKLVPNNARPSPTTQSSTQAN